MVRRARRRKSDPFSWAGKVNRAATWARGLREYYGDDRINSERLLARANRVLLRAAQSPDRWEALAEALGTYLDLNTIEGRALRSYIEVAVEGGEMRPSVAEMWAKRLSWPPFAGWADPISYDPMAEEMWTLPMAVSWISSRQPQTQPEIWDETPRPRMNWRGVSYFSILQMAVNVLESDDLEILST